MKVTTIVTTFNHERFIRQAVESVLSQQVPGGHDVIVVDDCSTDRTYEILTSVQPEGPPLRLIRSPSNENSNRRVAALIRESTAEYLAFLDGDDFWTSPFKLQRQVEYLDAHPECALCFHNAAIVQDAAGQHDFEPYNSVDQPRIVSIGELIRGNFIAGCSPVVRTSAIRDLPSWYDHQTFGDWPLYIHAARRGLIGYLPEKLGAYRIHGNGVWSAKPRRQQLDSILDFLQGLHDPLGDAYEAQIEASIRSYLCKGALYAEEDGELAAARGYLARAMQHARLPTEPEDRWTLRWRHWLLGHPRLHRRLASLKWSARGAADGVRAAWHVASRPPWRARSRARISVDPNPLAIRVGTHAGAATVSWTVADARRIEIRIGTPSGPLFSAAEGSGSAETGPWVQDGMLFLLQDASDSAARTSTTLARTRVRVLHTGASGGSV